MSNEKGVETRVRFTKLDTHKQIVYGEVYVPFVPDSQGDYMATEEIERIAHNFLKKGAVEAFDTEHSLRRNGSVAVESFIARQGDSDFIPGSWVLGIHIPDKQTWDRVLSGDIGGFSMYGTGRREPRTVEIELPDDGVVFGKTAASGNDDHQHLYTLKFALNGNFLGGETNEVAGHSHKIVKGTVTEAGGTNGHRHRFSFVDVFLKACADGGHYEDDEDEEMSDEDKEWKKKKRKEMKKWEEGDHPREPAGSPDGGQFVSEGGGSANDGAVSGKAQQVANMDKWNRGGKHKWVTKAIASKLPRIGATEKLGGGAKVAFKLFNPTGAGSWFITEANLDTGEAFGVADLGYGPEIGYMDLSEMRSFKGRMGLPLERDEHFGDYTVDDVMKGRAS